MFNFKKLDDETRKYMLKEFKEDLEKGSLYISERLNDHGKERYPELLKNAIISGTEESLSNDLLRGNYFNETEQRRNSNGIYRAVKVPRNANVVLAEGEFNRYYIRSICIQAINNGTNRIRVYRAKETNDRRPESEEKIGNLFDANVILEELRNTYNFDKVIKIPSGPNSGLSVDLV
jgi:hypothetical protein